MYGCSSSYAPAVRHLYMLMLLLLLKKTGFGLGLPRWPIFNPMDIRQASQPRLNFLYTYKKREGGTRGGRGGVAAVGAQGGEWSKRS